MPAWDPELLREAFPAELDLPGVKGLGGEGWVFTSGWRRALSLAWFLLRALGALVPAGAQTGGGCGWGGMQSWPLALKAQPKED